MKEGLFVQVLRNKEEDIVLQVNGTFVAWVEHEVCPPQESYAAVRVDRILYAVESGCKVWLLWSGNDRPFICLEGRGLISADLLGGLMDPRHEGFLGGIELRAEGPEDRLSTFTLLLDMCKQRN